MESIVVIKCLITRATGGCKTPPESLKQKEQKSFFLLKSDSQTQTRTTEPFQVALMWDLGSKTF
jgi:hypothetical protein